MNMKGLSMISINAAQTLHKFNTANISDNEKFNPQQNQLMMYLVIELYLLYSLTR